MRRSWSLSSRESEARSVCREAGGGTATNKPMIEIKGTGLVWSGPGLWGCLLSGSSSSCPSNRAAYGINFKQPVCPEPPLGTGKVWFDSILIAHCDEAIAFFADEWEFRPRERGSPFVVGRLARAAKDKWSPEVWQTYERIGHRPLAARVMGWRPPLKRQCGRPPEWAETLNVDACEVQPFLHSLHCLVTIDGGAMENWPRVGLEAMAAGVPIVAERRWGWLEMIDHGVNGFLGESNDQIAAYATELAHDEARRLKVAATGRQHVERLSEPQALWEGWRRLFDTL